MAAKFPTVEARQELGFTPSTAVRANIDVRQGDVGGAVGQALLAGAETLQERSERKEAIRVKNRANLDVLSAKQASNRRQLIQDEIATMKTDTPPENWEEETIKIVTKGNTDITGYDFSPEETLKQQIMSQGDLDSLPEQSFAAGARVISTAAIKTTEETLTALYREGDSQKIAQGVIDSAKTFKNNGVSAKAILLKLKAAQEAGEKLKVDDLVNQVHAALKVNDFGTAEVLAANPVIPEKNQTLLRNIISSAKSKLNDVAKEVDRDKLGNALVDGTIDYNMIDRTILDETEQETYRLKMLKESERKAKEEPILTDQAVKGQLEDMAYSIWTEAVSKITYDKALTNARYPTEGEPTIDDRAYDELKSLGTRELKSSQARGIQESSAYAKGQLVEVTNEIDWARILEDMDAGTKKKAISERKLQLDNWAQFNRSMKIWLSENDKAVESEFYIESRRKMPFYRKRTDEEIIGGKLPELPSPEALRKLRTEEAYEKGKKLGYWN